MEKEQKVFEGPLLQNQNEKIFKEYSQDIRNYYLLSYLQEEKETVQFEEKVTKQNTKIKLPTNVISFALNKILSKTSVITKVTVNQLLLYFHPEYRQCLINCLNSFIKDISLLTEAPFKQDTFSFNDQVQSYLVIHFAILFKEKYLAHKKRKKYKSADSIKKMMQDVFKGFLEIHFQPLFPSCYELITFLPSFTTNHLQLFFFSKDHYRFIINKVFFKNYPFIILDYCFKRLPCSYSEWNDSVPKLIDLFMFFYDDEVQNNWALLSQALSSYHFTPEQCKVVWLAQQEDEKKDEQLSQLAAYLMLAIKQCVFRRLEGHTASEIQETHEKELEKEQSRHEVSLLNPQTDQKMVEGECVNLNKEEVEKKIDIIDDLNQRIASIGKNLELIWQRIEEQKLINEKQCTCNEKIKVIIEEQKLINETQNARYEELFRLISEAESNSMLLEIHLRYYAERCYCFFGKMFLIEVYSNQSITQLKEAIDKTNWSDNCKEKIKLFLGYIQILLFNSKDLNYNVERSPIESLKKAFHTLNPTNKDQFDNIFDALLEMPSFKYYFYHGFNKKGFSSKDFNPNMINP